VAIVAVALLATGNDEALARPHKRHLYCRHVVVERFRNHELGRLHLVSQPPIRLAPMRYYGGPKSPMWRGPVEY
jgi:hypothetical protein